jgi:hypothetical protein
VGRIKLGGGIYGPGIMNPRTDLGLKLQKEREMKAIRMERNADSCVLYGVPKVGYGPEGITPFPRCLASVLKYMGQEISYTDVMGVSGAAFRLRWVRGRWFGGNVDVRNIFEDPIAVFQRSFSAVGRTFNMVERGKDSSKQEFIDLIRTEVDEGRPVIALGIIGPPEACIVTGYRDNGKTLLGWSFFQDMPEFAAGLSYDDAGYFVTQSWWENPETVALIAVGEERKEAACPAETLQNALLEMATPFDQFLAIKNDHPGHEVSCHGRRDRDLEVNDTACVDHLRPAASSRGTLQDLHRSVLHQEDP